MGKFANFFKRASEGIKNGATKVWNWGKNAVQKVGKVVKPAAEIAGKIGNFLSVLPGKAGLLGKGLAYGANAIRGITNMLPDSEAKTKINEYIDKGERFGTNTVDKVRKVTENINRKAQPWINSGVNIANHLASKLNT